MIPAFGMVILPQNRSTGNGQVPGWSCILSEDTAMAPPTNRIRARMTCVRGHVLQSQSTLYLLKNVGDSMRPAQKINLRILVSMAQMGA